MVIRKVNQVRTNDLILNRKKIFIFGDPSVGKTTLMRILINEDVSELYRPTIGLVARSRLETVDGTTCSFEIWECGGNHAYLNGVYQELFIDAAVLIFMAALDDSKSIENLKSWFEFAGLDATHAVSDPRSVLIILTKKDVIHAELDEVRDMKRKIIDMAPSNARVIFTSLKDESSRDKLRTLIFRLAMKHYLSPFARHQLLQMLKTKTRTRVPNNPKEGLDGIEMKVKGKKGELKNLVTSSPH